MVSRRGRINLRPSRLRRRFLDAVAMQPSWQFIADIWALIWEYRWYSAAIFAVTIFQEFAALWPVNLLGQFIDRLATGDLGNVVWLFLLASAFYPGLVRANVMLRHKMFYETDFRKMVELVLRVSDGTTAADSEAAGAIYTRTANAVSGITNATYHVLGSFTPVIIKIAIVSASLLRYNRTLGLVYLVSLIVPSVMTVVFNKWLRVLLDSQYSVASEVSGAAIRTIGNRADGEARSRFSRAMGIRKHVFLSLVYKGQFYLYARELALVGSQFLVVFVALGMRHDLGLTPGDFTRIVGYTTQVAAAFITTASCLDAIVSYSRAYHVFARGQQ